MISTGIEQFRQNTSYFSYRITQLCNKTVLIIFCNNDDFYSTCQNIVHPNHTQKIVVSIISLVQIKEIIYCEASIL